MKLITITAIAALVLIAAIGPTFALAPPWQVTATQTAPDSWEFTLVNNTPDLTAVGMDLDWSLETRPDFTQEDPTTVNWPATPIWSFIFPSWTADSYANGNGASDGIGPNTSVSGFKVTASDMPDLFTIYAVDSDGNDVLDNPTGSVELQAPQAPEPGTLAALFTGLAAIGGAAIKKRRLS